MWPVYDLFVSCRGEVSASTDGDDSITDVGARPRYSLAGMILGNLINVSLCVFKSQIQGPEQLKTVKSIGNSFV